MPARDGWQRLRWAASPRAWVEAMSWFEVEAYPVPCVACHDLQARPLSRHRLRCSLGLQLAQRQVRAWSTWRVAFLALMFWAHHDWNHKRKIREFLGDRWRETDGLDVGVADSRMRRAAASEGATWWLVSVGSAGIVATVVMASVGVVIPLEVAAMAEMDVVVSVAVVERTSLQCERKHEHYLRFQPVPFGECPELDGLERIDIVLPVGGAQDEATCT